MEASSGILISYEIIRLNEQHPWKSVRGYVIRVWNGRARLLMFHQRKISRKKSWILSVISSPPPPLLFPPHFLGIMLIFNSVKKKKKEKTLYFRRTVSKRRSLSLGSKILALFVRGKGKQGRRFRGEQRCCCILFAEIAIERECISEDCGKLTFKIYILFSKNSLPKNPPLYLASSLIFEY